MSTLTLSRHPDVASDTLVAEDAADRLLLDEAAPLLAAAGPSTVVVIGDDYGAIALGALAAHPSLGAVRVHQDRLAGQRAIEANADANRIDGVRTLPLDDELLRGASLVLLKLPRSLDELDEVASLVARHANPDVTVIAGGRIKHLSPGLNDVLLAHFGELRVGLARQKARTFTATGPKPGVSAYPKSQFHTDLGLMVCAHGGAFAGTRVDIGTRLLLSVLPQAVPDARLAIDLGCGTGILAAALAAARPDLTVIATDQSDAAVASARATVTANGFDDRITVWRDLGLDAQPDASADLIVLNPPFHIGAAVHGGEAERLFAEAARVLRPGGELWTVFNSGLGYRASLDRSVGPTRQIVRNTKFTVTASTARQAFSPEPRLK